MTAQHDSRRRHHQAWALAGALVLPAVGVAEPRMPATLVAQAAAVTPATQPPVAATAPLTLAQAYQLALAHDATLAAARAATDARRERLPQARSALLPNVSFNATRFKNSLETTQPSITGQPIRNEQEYFSATRTLTVRQPLFRAAEYYDYRQAQAQVEDANAQLELEVQTLAVRVTTAYLQALLAEDQLALARAQKSAFQLQLQAARKGFAGGAGTRTDVDEAQARLDLAVAQELEAAQDVGYTRRQLQVLTNQPVTALAALDAQRLPLAAPPGDGGMLQWIDRAEQSSPEIRGLQAQREAARLEISKQRAGHLPTLDAVAQWSVSDSDNVTRINSRFDNKSIGLQLTVPIYAGGMVNSRTRQAVAELERTEETLEATRRDLALRVEKEYRGVTEGVLRVRALEQAVRSAETVVESSRKSYQAGSRTLVDILNAEQQKVNAQRDLADARFRYLLSRIRLLSLAGAADTAAIDEASGWLKP